ncbi:hypothetical protein [Cupriavidus basilensis]|uniref:hypothetical protein n=1 Tax=Cupriavidus basilensis TaxID=68895 RepID=UPI0023E8FA9D|nr:hypothetical protein [Cupriavidus basilensis]MDF3884954.1 hypothetical protein [Cupriavidus basilensis]
MKILISAAVAALASFAALAQPPGIPATSDSNTHIVGPRDPYTDGAKAGRFDVYSDGARITDRRDPFTDGAHG